MKQPKFCIKSPKRRLKTEQAICSNCRRECIYAGKVRRPLGDQPDVSPEKH